MPRGETNRKLSDADIAEIVRMYTTPAPDGSWIGCNAIAARFGVASPTVLYRLRHAGVTIRDAKEAHANGKRCKPIKNLPPEGEDAPMCVCGCGHHVTWNQRKNRWNKYSLEHRGDTMTRLRLDSPIRDRDWLHEHYVVKGHTTDEIGAMCGVDRAVVLKYMRKFDIPRRDKSASRVGRKAREKNPAWKGGVTPERQRLYKAGNWRQFVKQVYARDKYTCQRCGAPKGGPKSLHAHHVKPWADNIALRFDIDNMVTLCRSCHTWIHSSANKEREFLD